MDKNDIIEPIVSLNELSKSIYETKTNICKYYNPTDIRLTVFSKLLNSVNSTKHSLYFLVKYLFDDKWWEDNIENEKSESEITNDRRQYFTYIKIGFVQTVFMSIEGNLRHLLQVINPELFEKSKRSFKLIYSNLCLKILAKKYLDFEADLDMFRYLRNTIHNNGVFFDLKGKDKEIEWAGKIYLFEHQKKLKFVQWELLVSIVDSIQLHLYEFVKDDKILEVKDTIQDLYFT